jgi:hypothetical protein
MQGIEIRVIEAQRTLIALANAQVDLAAEFTTVLGMDWPYPNIRVIRASPLTTRCHRSVDSNDIGG